VTETIGKCIHQDAIFGRLGGEEFAILCRYSIEENVIKQLENIREKVAALKIKTGSASVIQCTISTGVIKADENVKNLDELLHRADRLLYKAKGSGRNKTVFRI